MRLSGRCVAILSLEVVLWLATALRSLTSRAHSLVESLSWSSSAGSALVTLSSSSTRLRANGRTPLIRPPDTSTASAASVTVTLTSQSSSSSYSLASEASTTELQLTKRSSISTIGVPTNEIL
ncbi:hypothetical protein PR002_g27478 [Phytophthora rubi]|uniref:Secreted protein n=1 Tax=Phytophthora rubi TaxID=129364 RepID=A0A6A3HKK8_9STRA|nr:hypothetical protein PR002_g27478 [Phytophthora rubi]